ncbi:MAG TPA: hypothetical protein ENL42_04995, partial [Thermoplasmatales archaeon]|nr:hypothetical protein [Thermoplasmatales archaeon]
DVSEIRIGKWFSIMLKLFAPVILISIALASIIEMATEGYEGYPAWSLALGMIFVILSFIAAVIFARLRRCQQEQ